MGISVGLIWILFQKNTYLKFALVLFSLLFVVGVLMFWVVEHEISTESYMILFYIRRFIIQPLLIIVLIPAFYFQQLSSKVEK